MCAMRARDIEGLYQNKREEIGVGVRNPRGQIIVETEKVLEMFECVDIDLRSLRIFESGCDEEVNRELES